MLKKRNVSLQRDRAACPPSDDPRARLLALRDDARRRLHAIAADMHERAGLNPGDFVALLFDRTDPDARRLAGRFGANDCTLVWEWPEAREEVHRIFGIDFGDDEVEGEGCERGGKEEGAGPLQGAGHWGGNAWRRGVQFPVVSSGSRWDYRWKGGASSMGADGAATSAANRDSTEGAPWVEEVL